MIRLVPVWIRGKIAQLLPPGSLGARFAKGTFWAFLGTLIAQGLGMVASIVTARLLGTTGFGEYGMINSTIGTFGVFAGLGLGLTATKYIAEYRQSDPVRAGRILELATRAAMISSGLVALILLGISPWLATHTLNAPHLDKGLALGCLLLLFNSLNGLQSGALGGFEAFKTIAKVNFLRGILNFPLMLAGVWFFGLMGAISAQVLVSVAGWWLNHRAIRRECDKAGIPRHGNHLRMEIPTLWNFAFPAFLSGIVVGPFLWLSNTLLVHQPGGYGELGLLSVANQWRTVLMLLPGIFNSVALPMLSSGQENSVHFEKTMDISQSLSIMIILPAAAALLLGNRWIMLLYGPEYAAGGPVFVSLLTGVAIAGIGSAPGSAIQATGRMWLGALLNLTWGIALLGLTALFVPHLGGFGLALAFALAYVFLALWAYVYLFFRHLISLAMFLRVFVGMAFLVMVALLALLVPEKILWTLIPPVLLLALWLALWVLPAPFVRLRLLNCLRSGKTTELCL